MTFGREPHGYSQAVRVLLTGGAGYIGSHVALALLAAGHEALIVDDFSNAHPSVVEQLARIAGRKVPVERLDVRDTTELVRVLQGHGPIDAVVHLAGLKAVSVSVREPARYYDVNIGSAVSVVRAMGELGIAHIVFSSSATVYGHGAPAPVPESYPAGSNLTNPYGRTKHVIELLLRDVVAADPGFRATILRYFNPVGAHPSGLIGDAHGHLTGNLLPSAARAAVEGEPVSVYGDDYDTPDGTALRDYVHVVDLAVGHVKALEHEHSGMEIFNLGTGQPSSVLEILRAYEDAVGREVPHRFAPRRAGDVPVSYADVRRAETVLGWKARLTVADACRDDWAFRQQLG